MFDTVVGSTRYRARIIREPHITTVTESVGEPSYRSEGLEPDAVESQYVSDIGRNNQDPLPTGLQG